MSASEISRLLNEGTSVRIEARHGDWEGSVFNDGFMYVYGDAAINRNIGTDAVDLTLASTNDLQVAGGASIAASGESRLNVTLHADVDKSEAEPDGRGSLIIGEPAGGSPMLVGREAAQAVVLGPNEVVIDTNGGELVLTGAGQPPVNQSDQGLTNAAGVRITNATLNAGQGSVTITGAGGSTGSEGSSQNGVDIDNAAIAGSSVSIEGTSTSATGVRLNDTDITATSGPITVVGKSEGGGPVGQHMGVDIDQDVVMRTGAGGVKIHGLAVGGGAGSAGLRINSLRILTADSGAAPLITLVGQTMQTSGAGLQVTSGGSGLVVESAASEDSGVSLASTADIVIGASADPEAQSLLLGDVAPQLNTTGRINIRPMSMEINNPAQATSLNDRVIHIGSAEGSGSGFNIDRRWFGLPAAGGTPPSARYVIGSNTHTGRISVQAGALDGAGAVTLQNQGEGTQGIALGGQTGIRQLNLLSSGPITQTGAIDAEVLNLIVGQGANVQLTAAGNRFGTLNVEGAQTPPNVTPGAQPNSVEQDITGFDTATPAFQRFTIAAVTGNGGSPEGGPEREIDRSFEGSDMLNELRTDVYVHGQLSRPQVCTPANTATGGLALGDGGADALALEWVKVRRGPQLTNCAGMRADSSCAAF